MPKKAYALDLGGSSRVEIAWRGMWKETRIRIDGAELGVIATRKELETGRDFTLPTGGLLTVRLAKNFLGPELHVMRDGVALPGSMGDPAERVKQAAYVLYFIAAFNAGLGVLAEAGSVDLLRSLGIGWTNVVEGSIYAILGWRTSKRSQVALGLGIALFALDAVMMVVAPAQAGQAPPVGGLVARLFFFVPLVKGLQGMRGLRGSESAAGPTLAR